MWNFIKTYKFSLTLLFLFMVPPVLDSFRESILFDLYFKLFGVESHEARESMKVGYYALGVLFAFMCGIDIGMKYYISGRPINHLKSYLNKKLKKGRTFYRRLKLIEMPTETEYKGYIESEEIKKARDIYMNWRKNLDDVLYYFTLNLDCYSFEKSVNRNGLCCQKLKNDIESLEKIISEMKMKHVSIKFKPEMLGDY